MQARWLVVGLVGVLYFLECNSVGRGIVPAQNFLVLKWAAGEQPLYSTTHTAIILGLYLLWVVFFWFRTACSHQRNRNLFL